MTKNWYVVHTQTGAEEKVKITLENRISQEGLQELISKVIISRIILIPA